MIKKIRGKRILAGLAMLAAATLGLTSCEAASSPGSVPERDGKYTFILAKGALEGTPHAAVEQAYLDAVEEASDGRIEFRRTSFQALCNLDEIVDCIRDGRAHIGTTVTDYTPYMLPSLSVVSISFLNTDIQATTAALYDVHQEYEPAKALLEDNNLHYVTTWPVGAMFLGSDKELTNMDDLKGLRARAAGPITQHTLESVGVNVNAITAAETYESLQRGVIDSVASALDFGVNYKITEQLPYWTDPGLGQYTAYGMWWNKAAYDSLPDDLQEVVDEVTEEFNYGKTVENYNEQMEDVCQGMLDSPDVKNFTTWDESATKEWKDKVSGGTEDLWLNLVEGYGFEEGEEYLARYKEAYAENVSEDNPQDAALSCVDRWQAQNK